MSGLLEDAYLEYLRIMFHGYAPEPTTPEEAETVETLRLTFFAGARVYQKLMATGEKEQAAIDHELFEFRREVNRRAGGGARFVVVEETGNEPKS
jgi:hypothetical protein